MWVNSMEKIKLIEPTIEYKKDKIYIYRDDKIILRINRIIENSKYLTHKIIETNGRNCIIAYNNYHKKH